MQFITQKDFKDIVDVCPYYKDRWGYFKGVIDVARKTKAKSIIEIGVYKLPVSKQSKTMDITPDWGDLTYHHDAKQIPYDFIGDKEFDLLIAMQCLEHLHPHQKEVFAEWKRIAKTIIISLPYLWHCPDDVMHHQINRDKIKEWTELEPDSENIVDCRIILEYKIK